MTIAAAYLTSEGLVLGADSKTTYAQGGTVHQLLDHAQKIYEIGSESRFGICTWGAGKIGEMSHRTVVAKVADAIHPATARLEDAVSALVKILESWAASATVRNDVGYFVGGVEPDHTPRCVRIECSFAGTPASPTYSIAKLEMGIGDARFEGAPDYFARMFHGIAAGFPEAIRDGLRPLITNCPADFDQLFAKAFDAARPRFISAGARDLPLREAIDFVHTYLQLTVKAFKFRAGAPFCGGPLEIGYISTDRTFRWAKHKLFDSAIRENETWKHP